jgi:hypothetical protein
MLLRYHPSRVEVGLHVTLDVFAIRVLIDSGQHVAVDDVFNFSPKMRIFVRLKHLIGGRIGENAVEKDSKVSCKGKGDCEKDPKINGHVKIVDFEANETINAA